MKFTLRDLFLVTMIVALVLGWWMDRHSLHALLVHEVIRREAAESDAAWLATDWQNQFINGETAVRTGEVLRKYGALPNSSAPALSPPKK